MRLPESRQLPPVAGFRTGASVGNCRGLLVRGLLTNPAHHCLIAAEIATPPFACGSGGLSLSGAVFVSETYLVVLVRLLPKAGKSRHCSVKCRKRATAIAAKKAKQCAQCGNSFLPLKSAKAAYCSATCKRKRYRILAENNPARMDRKKQSERNR